MIIANALPLMAPLSIAPVCDLELPGGIESEEVREEEELVLGSEFREVGTTLKVTLSGELVLS